MEESKKTMELSEEFLNKVTGGVEITDDTREMIIKLCKEKGISDEVINGLLNELETGQCGHYSAEVGYELLESLIVMILSKGRFPA